MLTLNPRSAPSRQSLDAIEAACRERGYTLLDLRTVRVRPTAAHQPEEQCRAIVYPTPDGRAERATVCAANWRTLRDEIRACPTAVPVTAWELLALRHGRQHAAYLDTPIDRPSDHWCAK